MCLILIAAASSVSLALGTLSFLPNQWRIAIKWSYWELHCLKNNNNKNQSCISFPFLKANSIHSSILVKGLTIPFLLLFFLSLL